MSACLLTYSIHSRCCLILKMLKCFHSAILLQPVFLDFLRCLFLNNPRIFNNFKIVFRFLYFPNINRYFLKSIQSILLLFKILFSNICGLWGRFV